MIEKVIEQLPQEKYDVLYLELLVNKAEKLIFLLDAYRDSKKKDEEIIKDLGISSNSFYSLRSRLFDKIQQFLFRESEGDEAMLMKNVYSIPTILFEYPRESAIALLTHLEMELIKLDMQSQLISVYNGLKKLHMESDQYYHFEQCYNKSVAYTLSQEKAEELLSLFSKALTSFLLSRETSKKEMMLLYLVGLNNLALLYDSPRLSLFHKIGCINYRIFVEPRSVVFYSEKTTEELMDECRTSLKSAPSGNYNLQLNLSLQYLSFQYYHRLKLYKDSIESANDLMNCGVQMFNLYPFISPYIFLIQLVERNISENLPMTGLKTYFESIKKKVNDNAPFFVYYHLGMAAISYEEDNLTEANSCLQQLINFPWLKKQESLEIEIKLFYVFIVLLLNKSDLAEGMLRNIIRKGNFIEESSEQIQQLIFILKQALSNKSAAKEKKILEAFKMYKLMAQTDQSILNYIQIKQKDIIKLIQL